MSTMDLALPFVAGAAAGALYLATLWLSVRGVTRGGLAPAWLLVSAVVRMALLIAAFFWIMGGEAARLVAALVGFTLVRLAATWPMRGIGKSPRRAPGAKRREARDAPDAG